MMGRRGYYGYGRYNRWGGWSPGLILVGIGVLFLLIQGLALAGAFWPLLLGGLFVVLAERNHRGFLIPGGLLLGIAAGSILAGVLGIFSGGLAGAASVAGIGAGFWFIHLFDRARRPFSNDFRWATIPGTILLFVAAGLALTALTTLTLRMTWQFTGLLLHWWPVLLIVGGLALFFSHLRRRPY
jgi:hypothetical protein